MVFRSEMIRDENQPNSVNADLDTGILIDWMAAALQVTDQRENLESWFGTVHDPV